MSIISQWGPTANPLGVSRKGRGRWKRAGLAVLAVGVALPLGATSANAAFTDVAEPHLIELLPGLDIVSLEGYDMDQPLVVEVWRDGLKIGSSGSPKTPGYVVPDADQIAEPMGTIFEINHDGSLCWSGHTPDIVPGDEIRVITEDGPDPVGERATVENIVNNGVQKEALDADGEFNDVIMTGRALQADGTPMDETTFFDTGSAEIVQPAFRDVGVPDAADEDGWDRRVLGADVTGVAVPDGETFGLEDVGTLEYDDTTGDWTATWKNLPVPTADRPSFADLALDGEHSFSVVVGAGTEETGGQAITLASPGDASGGAQGCPAGISDGVTGTSPTNVNIATAGARGEMVVSGKSYNANLVHLTIDDSDGDTSDAIAVNNVVPNNQALLTETTGPVEPVKQTWRAAVPMSQIRNRLDDGELTVSGLFDRVVETTEDRHDPAFEADGTTPKLEPAFEEDGTTASPDTDETLYRDNAGSLVQATNPDGTPMTDGAGNPVYTRQLTEDVATTYYQHSVTQIGGASHTLLKDLVAPGVPSASPGEGVYTGPQHVTLNGQDDIEETVRYRIGGADVPSPTVGSRAADDQIVVSSSQTIKARSYDRAGNASPLFTAAYTINGAGGGPGGPDTLAPVVASTAPVANRNAIDVGRNVRVTFDEGVTGISAATFRLRNTRTNVLVPARVTYSPVTGVARLNPARRLAADTRYAATLRPGITDAAGNPVRLTRWSFTTGAAPRVAASTPDRNARGVDRARHIRVKMSERVVGVRRATVQLRQAATGDRVAARVSYRKSTRTIVVNPRRDLAKRARYTVTLTRGLKDTAGNPLRRTKWGFTTGRSRF